MKTFLIVAGIIFIIMLFGTCNIVSTYNELVKNEEAVNNAWSQVENQYQRRYDLIPNLVSTVQGMANFEKSTLTAVIEARASVGQIKVTKEVLENKMLFQQFQQKQGDLTQALSRLMVITENYPNLKANENFLQLQSQLESTENRIAVERKRYSEVAQNYNTYLRQLLLPKLVASFGSFTEKAYFQAEQNANKAPKIVF